MNNISDYRKFLDDIFSSKIGVYDILRNKRDEIVQEIIILRSEEVGYLESSDLSYINKLPEIVKKINNIFISLNPSSKKYNNFKQNFFQKITNTKPEEEYVEHFNKKINDLTEIHYSLLNMKFTLLDNQSTTKNILIKREAKLKNVREFLVYMNGFLDYFNSLDKDKDFVKSNNSYENIKNYLNSFITDLVQEVSILDLDVITTQNLLVSMEVFLSNLEKTLRNFNTILGMTEKVAKSVQYNNFNIDLLDNLNQLFEEQNQISKDVVLMIENAGKNKN